MKFLGGAKHRNTKKSLVSALDLLVKRRGIQAHQPVFTFINLMGTHAPYDPPPWAFKKFYTYTDCSLALLRRINTFVLDPGHWLMDDMLQGEAKDLLDAVYDAEVLIQDSLLGDFFEALRLSGGLRNTWLILVADHGEYLGEKGLLNHVFDVYPELIRVPLLIRSPSAERSQGRVLDDLVSTRRLFHTILTVANVADVDERSLSLVDRSIQGCKQPLEREAVFSEAVPAVVSLRRVQKRRADLTSIYGYDQPVRAIYHDGYKLVVKRDKASELYVISDGSLEFISLNDISSEYLSKLFLFYDKFMMKPRPLYNQTTEPKMSDEFVNRLRSLGYLD